MSIYISSSWSLMPASFSVKIWRKYEEICAPRVEEFCFITDNTYAREEVSSWLVYFSNYGSQIFWRVIDISSSPKIMCACLSVMWSSIVFRHLQRHEYLYKLPVDLNCCMKKRKMMKGSTFSMTPLLNDYFLDDIITKLLFSDVLTFLKLHIPTYEVLNEFSQVVKMESRVLNFLHFHLSVPTTKTFLR